MPPGAQLLPDQHLAQGAQDDPQSRFINERSHANIQKDGTYSDPADVGRRTTADELRPHSQRGGQVPHPHRQGHWRQRIDLLGVREDPWRLARPGMPSGHAYAKALRTVKTCGQRMVPFPGTQDATQMGKDLERRWRRTRPIRVKLAVPGCLRTVPVASASRRRCDRRRFGLGKSSSPAMAASRPRWPSSCQGLATAEEVLNTRAPSCSSTARREWYLERTCHYVAAWGWTT